MVLNNRKVTEKIQTMTTMTTAKQTYVRTIHPHQDFEGK